MVSLLSYSVGQSSHGPASFKGQTPEKVLVDIDSRTVAMEVANMLLGKVERAPEK